MSDITGASEEPPSAVNGPSRNYEVVNNLHVPLGGTKEKIAMLDMETLTHELRARGFRTRGSRALWEGS